MIRHIVQYLSIVTGVLILISGCSDSSSDPDLGGDLGQVSLTVSGDVQGEKTGMADFYGQDLGSLHYWELSFNDFSPQTYSLQLSLQDFEEIERPAPGSYEIGFNSPNPFGESGPPVFTAIYTHIPNGSFTDAVEYSSGILCGDDRTQWGTLVISSSTSSEVSGSFTFFAIDIDIDNSGNCVILGEIEVAGEFSARARQF
ncbi:MAG: hypothetical protein EA391_03715 [Balneolaceae bacterium]|nr:MAG: hypothetical protein EA391_03715 [Balneolaceae bacterium]